MIIDYWLENYDLLNFEDIDDYEKRNQKLQNKKNYFKWNFLKIIKRLEEDDDDVIDDVTW